MTRMTGVMVCLLLPVAAGAQQLPRDAQIAQALLAAPADRRDGAMVVGFEGGKATTLRPGTNDLVCVADNPAAEGITVSCYHKDLEPFMARGRELAEQGHKGKERHEIRWKDVDEGRVKMVREPRMLYVMTGKGFDAASGKVIDSYLRWVVYIPYATTETTGIPSTSGDAPWIMYAGTAGAHIMISPPRPQ